MAQLLSSSNVIIERRRPAPHRGNYGT